MKIGGGSPRSYYLLVDLARSTSATRVCVLPRGAEEGEELRAHRGHVRAARRPAGALSLAHQHRRARHRAGDLVRIDESYDALPDLVAVIEGTAGRRRRARRSQLHVQLTEVGTLEMSLVARSRIATRRYRLEFQLRGEQRDAGPLPPARVSQLHPRFRDATELLAVFYGKAQKISKAARSTRCAATSRRCSATARAGTRRSCASCSATLLAGGKRRRRSADHERLWFHFDAATACARASAIRSMPGASSRSARSTNRACSSSPDAAVWTQFWILWRRIAGGLDDAQQTRILDDLASYLNPRCQRRGEKRARVRARSGLEDMVRLAGSLERLSAARKVELGDWLFARIDKQELSHAGGYWSARPHRRARAAGTAARTASCRPRSRRLARSLARARPRRRPSKPRSPSRNSRASSTTARAICSPELRERAARSRSRKLRGSETWVQLVREGGELSASEATHIFGESLPPGLRLL